MKTLHVGLVGLATKVDWVSRLWRTHSPHFSPFRLRRYETLGGCLLQIIGISGLSINSMFPHLLALGG